MNGRFIISVGIGVLSLICLLYSCDQEKEMSSEVLMYIGTYTAKGSQGIYGYKLDSNTGEVELLDSISISNPSFLTTSPNNKIIYAVSENNDKERDGITSYQIDAATGKLSLLDSVLIEGEAPCYVLSTPNGEWVATANYGSGNISMVQVNSFGMFDKSVNVIQFAGSGPHERQTQSHLHAIYMSPDNRYIFANDLGGDKIYRFDNQLDLSDSPVYEFDVKAGSGPRHTVFHPNGKWAYTITELSGEVIAFNYTDGILEEFQTVEADTLKAQGSGDIQITPDGKFLYASNRLKGDGVAIFSVDQENGRLEKVGYQTTGLHPRNMAITPDGELLLVACKDSDAVELYKIDKKKGLLENMKKDIKLSLPVFIKLIPR